MALSAFVLAIAVLMRLNAMIGRITSLQTRVRQLEEILQKSAISSFSKKETSEKPQEPRKAPLISAPVKSASIPAATAAAGPSTTSHPPTATETASLSAAALTASLEQRFGARWSVWLGMLTLSLGGVFLVKYGIESGLLTPAVRLALGAALAAFLLWLGEFARRRELASPLPFVAQAHIPGAITASGIISAYATVLAAHALYGFLSAATAFVVLAIVSFVALALALRHGPVLAAIGLLGAVAVPFLLGGGRPVVWLLFAYHLLVAAATAALAHARDWRWLGMAAIASALAIAGLSSSSTMLATYLPHFLAYLAGLMLITALFVHHPASHEHLAAHPDLRQASSLLLDIPATLFITVAMVGVIPAMIVNHFATSALMLAAGLLAFGVWLAWRYASLVLLLPVSAVLVLILLAIWNPASTAAILQLQAPEDEPLLLLRQETHRYLAAVALLAGSIVLAALFAARKRFGQPLFAAPAALLAPLAFVIATWHTNKFAHVSLRAGVISLLLALAFAAAAELFLRLADKGCKQPRYFNFSGSLLAASATAFVALTMTLTLERGWLTIALALLVSALAWIGRLRNVGILHYLALLLAGVVMARVLHEPRIMGDDVGAWPIFNWLLYGYGIPAMSFWLASRQTRNVRPTWIADALESGALFFLVLLIILQIRHLMTGGNIYSPTFTLAENALHTIALLSLSLAQSWFAHRSSRHLPRLAGHILLGLSLLTFAGGQLLLNNPLLTDLPATFSTLALAFLVPAVLLAFRSWLEPASWRRHVIGGVALFSCIIFITLVIRHVYHPETPAFRHGAYQPEWIAYSIAWLLFALALLSAGLLLRHRELRIGGLALLAMVVMKVFLSDMAHLAGIWRALSFIGLGLSLLAIGWVYQRLIGPSGPEDNTTSKSSQENPPGSGLMRK